MKISVSTRFRGGQKGSYQIGGSFLKIDEPTRERIDKFVIRSMDISRYRFAFNTAMFLICVDAMVRTCLYLLHMYYDGTPLLKGFTPSGFDSIHGTALSLYISTSFAAFILSDRLTHKNLVLSLALAAYASSFVAYKVFLHSQARIWEFEYTFFKCFFVWESAIAVWGILAVAVGIMSLRRLFFIVDAYKEHTTKPVRAA
jgi:hypothetical protein